MSQSFKQLFEEMAQTDEFWVEDVITEFTNSIYKAMDEQGITKVELAKRLNTTPSAVTRLLAGDANFTFKTVVRLARAVNRSFHPSLGSAQDWTLVWEERVTPAIAQLKSESSSQIPDPLPYPLQVEGSEQKGRVPRGKAQRLKAA